MADGIQPTAGQNTGTGATVPVLVVAFLLTAAMLFLVLPRLTPAVAPEYGLGFADGYDLIANNLINGHGYRFYPNTSETMLREPGYPLFLAGVFKLAGYSLTTVRWSNWLLTIGIAFLLLRLTLIVTNDRNTSLLATLLFLLYPGTVISEARGGVEILFVFVVLAFMVLLYRAVERKDLWRYFVCGLSLGVVVEVRSTPMVFPFFLLVYLLLFSDRSAPRLKSILNVGVVVLGMAIVMTPWLVRNYLLVHHLVPTATVQGVAVQEGQYTCQHLNFDDEFYAVQIHAGNVRDAIASDLGFHFEGAYYQVFYDAHDEWSFNRILFQRAEREYTDHPALLATCACKNLFNFWFLGKTWQATRLNMLVQIPLLSLTLIGLYIQWKRGELSRMGIILTFIVCIVLVHLPTIAHARHSMPLVPFLAIPASVSAVSIWLKYRTRAQTHVPPEV